MSYPPRNKPKIFIKIRPELNPKSPAQFTTQYHLAQGADKWLRLLPLEFGVIDTELTSVLVKSD